MFILKLFLGLILVCTFGHISQTQAAERNSYFTSVTFLPWFNVIGGSKELKFIFADNALEGKLYYGPYSLNTPIPNLNFHKDYVEIKEGEALLDLTKINPTYDVNRWAKDKKETLGFRVIDKFGRTYFDSRVSFIFDKSIKVLPSIILGPDVNIVTDTSVLLSFTTDLAAICSIEVSSPQGQKIEVKDAKVLTDHQFHLKGLTANTTYQYVVKNGVFEEKYFLKTAPTPGTRQPFTFTFSSDTRGATGGSEHDIYGVDAAVLKKIGALALFKKAQFIQFNGDLIEAGSPHVSHLQMRYFNWHFAIDNFTHFIPVYTTMGNYDSDANKFPTTTAEAVFAQNFINFDNGPAPEKDRYPPYKENVYYYIYDNVAMIVLNSNYNTQSGGNVPGYIMDGQYNWFVETLAQLQKDERIDHIFVNLHAAFFPNGGHLYEGLWHHGNNGIKPANAPKGTKGILERRDQLIDAIQNNPKVVAILTGDEHNYCRMQIGATTNLYTQNYNAERIQIKRPFWQITAGSAAHSYHAQENVPWTPSVVKFSANHALSFFHINKENVTLEVLDLETLATLDVAKLK
ncbi:MAG: metallophosphoesterase [Pseudomonadota bacterium]